MVVLVTNDDGYKAAGLRELYRAARLVFGKNVVAVVPDTPQSSSGMSFTFHKPLRVVKTSYEGMQCFTVSGTPADCVFIANYHMFKGGVDLVLSGINEGMNAGLETMYSSGTISAAMFAAISEIPSVALSKNIPKNAKGEYIKKSMKASFNRLVFILNRIKKFGLPEGSDILNINFPIYMRRNTPIKIVKTDSMVFEDKVIKKMDPLGRHYYWLYGTLKKNLDKEADLYSLFRGNITITPIRLSESEYTALEKARKVFS